ncbi:hypothetical protein EIP91_004532 [Steccherinum ochraceum]|uniref:Uncharacterized protein n=1 Tax=Steccherinum ochraceum TaxID=92696 RepID=A0A4R0RH58_9APHY|nr:hypothetical protein EIP91_004532 [Steccherinum ochraceum]
MPKNEYPFMSDCNSILNEIADYRNIEGDSKMYSDVGNDDNYGTGITDHGKGAADLSSTPADVQMLIADKLATNDLSAYTKTCRGVKEYCQPILFRTALFKINGSGPTRLYQFHSTVQSNPSMGINLRHLKLSAPLNTLDPVQLVGNTFDQIQDTINVGSLHDLLQSLPAIEELLIVGHHFTHNPSQTSSPYRLRLRNLTVVHTGFWTHVGTETADPSTAMEMWYTSPYAQSGLSEGKIGVPNVFAFFISAFESVDLLRFANISVIPFVDDHLHPPPYTGIPTTRPALHELEMDDRDVTLQQFDQFRARTVETVYRTSTPWNQKKKILEKTLKEMYEVFSQLPEDEERPELGDVLDTLVEWGERGHTLQTFNTLFISTIDIDVVRKAALEMLQDQSSDRASKIERAKVFVQQYRREMMQFAATYSDEELGEPLFSLYEWSSERDELTYIHRFESTERITHNWAVMYAVGNEQKRGSPSELDEIQEGPGTYSLPAREERTRNDHEITRALDRLHAETDVAPTISTDRWIQFDANSKRWDKLVSEFEKLLR